MKPKLLTLLLLLVATVVAARPQLHDLDVKVVLSRNGDAHITETRRMSIDSEGTECYIGLANMGPSEVTNLEVTDETGVQYQLVDWDVKASRDWKTQKCGILKTNHGYELCWGLGGSGERTYITSYTMTCLVRGYSDADGLRHVFLDEGVSPKPEHAKVTIVGEDTTLVFRPDTCGIWGFRFDGNLWFEQGTIVAETASAMTAQAGLYVMAQFPKGMFAPTYMDNGTFEEKKQQALEGSDYTSGDEEVDWDDPETFFGVIYVLIIFLSPVVGGAWYTVYKWRARRRVYKNLMWYRDIPLNGNLVEANKILNAYKWGGADYNNLMSACILKLINQGAISIELRPTRKGKMRRNFVIHELKNPETHPLLLRKIYNMFKMAAGEDTVLEPDELRNFMKSSQNISFIDSFLNTLRSKTSIRQLKKHENKVRQVLGLKKFLEEFTLLDERGVDEVKLWKDYMIYATLFGIADQVIRDMKKINPAYFNMDRIAGQMADDMTLPLIYSTLHRGTSQALTAKTAREHRASGGGGHSSWGGGGGGFSGGGGGGGVR